MSSRAGRGMRRIKPVVGSVVPPVQQQNAALLLVCLLHVVSFVIMM